MKTLLLLLHKTALSNLFHTLTILLLKTLFLKLSLHLRKFLNLYHFEGLEFFNLNIVIKDSILGHLEY